MLKAMALGPGLPTSMVWPSPFWRITSMVPMVPPPPERFSTTADWPQAVCRCAASSRPITSVVPPAAAGMMMRTVSVGRQSAPRLARGKIAAAEIAVAPVKTRRREKALLVTSSLPAGSLFCRQRRDLVPNGQAGDLVQVLAAGPWRRSSRAATNALVEAEHLEQRRQVAELLAGSRRGAADEVEDLAVLQPVI